VWKRAKRPWPACLELNLIRIERCSRGLKVDAEGLGCPSTTVKDIVYARIMWLDIEGHNIILRTILPTVIHIEISAISYDNDNIEDILLY
jgi:hypothetical protein